MKRLQIKLLRFFRGESAGIMRKRIRDEIAMDHRRAVSMNWYYQAKID
jgi:uncharacterized protein YdaU (DUF1376 family)